MSAERGTQAREVIAGIWAEWASSEGEVDEADREMAQHVLDALEPFVVPTDQLVAEAGRHERLVANLLRLARRWQGHAKAVPGSLRSYTQDDCARDLLEALGEGA
ncbi:hypothetical protein GCM10027586_03780 [Kineococcus gypseus]|uniref:hypothetical protein n=1 Tax=Kineococcus gypseus TaxID=1637102 RepID=UPI003D7D2693